MADYFGILGLVLILAGWVWEFYQALKSNTAGVPLSFALLYGAGSLLLTLHSIQLGDTVFIILNAAATLIAVANAIFAITRGKRKR
ncbi:MAG: hypothetical protein NTX79_06820 [Candidatus Micrarchaeota archaeon]|nr:hypothetical protein [Candidatus Micrarchaeota archaeon]